jgi:hypothetical protein
MRVIVFHPLADQELVDAVAYYEEQKLGLGLEYLEEVEYAVNLLVRYSEAGSKVRGSIRRLVLPKDQGFKALPFTALVMYNIFQRKGDKPL